MAKRSNPAKARSSAIPTETTDMVHDEGVLQIKDGALQGTKVLRRRALSQKERIKRGQDMVAEIRANKLRIER